MNLKKEDGDVYWHCSKCSSEGIKYMKCFHCEKMSYIPGSGAILRKKYGNGTNLPTRKYINVKYSYDVDSDGTPIRKVEYLSYVKKDRICICANAMCDKLNLRNCTLRNCGGKIYGGLQWVSPGCYVVGENGGCTNPKCIHNYVKTVDSSPKCCIPCKETPPVGYHSVS